MVDIPSIEDSIDESSHEVFLASRFRRAGHAAVEEIAAYYEKLQLGGEGFQVAPSMKPGDLFKQIPGTSRAA